MRKNLRKFLVSGLVCVMYLSLVGYDGNQTMESDLTTPDGVVTHLKLQNEAYLTAIKNDGDISINLREELVENGQSPYVTVLTCSDSRVPPEHIFMEGLGEIFTVRNAGNVVDEIVLGSIEYGAEHLATPIVLVLGHTNCGAVDATINSGAHGYITYITDRISQGIGDETDPTQAEILNTRQSIEKIMESAIISELVEEGKVKVVGAIYDTCTGVVSFLDDENITD